MVRHFLCFLFAALSLSATISEVIPNQTTAGTGPLTIRVLGDYFLPGETLAFNGTRLVTTLVGGGGMYDYSTELRATVPADLLRTPGRANVSLVGGNSLPFTINPPLAIITPSPLPRGAVGTAYSRLLEASGGTPRFDWSLTANSALPPGLVLNRATGLISGTPTAPGEFSFTAEVRDQAGAIARRLYLLAIGAPGSAPNTISCAVTPQNTLLPVHVPEAHRNSAKLYPDHTLRVVLRATSGNVGNIPVTLVASQPLFPDASGLPAALSATANTDLSGTAVFTINPLTNREFDETQVTASGTRGSTEADRFACSGSVVSGAGTMFGVLQNVRRDTAVVLGALERRFEADGDRLFPELDRLLQADARLEKQALRAYDQYLPLLRKLFAGEKPSLAKRELADLDRLVASLEERASPQLREVLLDWRRNLRCLRPAVRFPAAPSLTGFASLPLTPGQDPQAQSQLARRPLSFERNAGQAPSRIHFLARGLRESAWMGEDGLHLESAQGAVVEMRLRGRSRWPAPHGLNPLPTRSHYLRANGTLSLEHYERIRYASVYPKTDLLFYSQNGQLRYDFVLAPGADPSRIALDLRHVPEITAQPDGSLLLHHASGTTRLSRPFAYQTRNGERIAIAARYRLLPRGGIGFELGQYDAQLPLVIDPLLSFSAFHGGAEMDSALAIAVDTQGSAYVAGFTSSPNWPANARALNAALAPSPNNVQAFVTKFSPDGRSVLFTTYFGGSRRDGASSLALDAAGNLYVAGQTDSPDFPTRNAFQATYGGGDIETGGDAYLLKLNPTGDTLIYSTYLGGARGEMARGLAVDSTGAAYVTGMTSSQNFPVRNALQPNSRGGQAARSDAYLTKLSPTGDSLIYSTYLGGSGDDYGLALALDAQNKVVVTGATYSLDFPTMLALQPASHGGAEVFLAKLNATGSALTYSSYFGGSADDFALALALDSTGNVHIGGITGSLDFPLRRAVQTRFGAQSNLGFDGFAAKFLAFSNDLVYSTYLGGAGIDAVNAVAVGSDGALFLAGETNSADFPTRARIRPQGALSDAFLTKLSPDGSTWEYSGALGGQAMETAAALALDRAGNVYLAGTTSSRDNPSTAEANQTLLGGRSDAFAMKIAPGTSPNYVSLVSAASLQPGQIFAPEAIVSAFGENLAPRLEAATSSTLPTTLAGVTVFLRDSLTTLHRAPLYFVAPTQINFLLPREAAPGLASLSISSAGQEVALGHLLIVPYAPGLFTANADGRGALAGFAVQSSATQPLFRCGATAGSCAPNPVDITQPTFLTLYGTGLRGASPDAAITLAIDGLPVPVTFAGAQGQFPGLDQLNAGPLPDALRGRGVVELLLRIGTETANRTSIHIQ